MKKFFLLSLCYLMSCGDVTGPARQTGELLFRTPNVDYTHGASVLSDASILVYGYAEGQIGVGDWTNAFPMLLFMDSNGLAQDTMVYRDIRYGAVIGAAPFGDEVAVLIDSAPRGAPAEPNSLKLYLLEANHTLGDVILTVADSMERFFAPPQPLIATADNGLILNLDRDAKIGDFIKIGSTGKVQWNYSMPNVQDVRSVAETEDGDILALGVPFVVARLSATGQVRWQKNYKDEGRVDKIVAVKDGAAVLGSRFISTGVETIVLTRLDNAGDVLWERTYEEASVAIEALTALPDGGLIFAWSKSFDGENAELVRLDAEGEVIWRRSFGTQGTTRVSQILTLANNRLAVVGVTGPERIAGFGSDDFDILVVLLDN